MGKTIQLLWVTVAEQGRWLEPEESQSLGSCQGHAREDSPQHVVTIRESEERGICSAALKELFTIVLDQIEERSVVVIVLNKESATWKDASMKTLTRDDQLKYIDVEGMRVVIDNRCIAKQTKSDKVENVATGGSKKYNSITINKVKIGK